MDDASDSPEIPETSFSVRCRGAPRRSLRPGEAAAFILDLRHLMDLEISYCNLTPHRAWYGAFVRKALRTGTSLRHVCLLYADLTDAQVLATLRALAHHRDLRELCLEGHPLSLEHCKCLRAILRGHATGGLDLSLCHADLDDRALIVILPGLGALRRLDLGSNDDLTAAGWAVLAAQLASPETRLQELVLHCAGVDDRAAGILATSLRRNTALECLRLDNNAGLTAAGWRRFATLLCDPASAGATHASNHTLRELDSLGASVPAALRPCLALNAAANKRDVAVRKILRAHPALDVAALFRPDLAGGRALPAALRWFRAAEACARGTALARRAARGRLSALYQFLHGSPEALEVLCARARCGRAGRGGAAAGPRRSARTEE